MVKRDNDKTRPNNDHLRLDDKAGMFQTLGLALGQAKYR